MPPASERSLIVRELVTDVFEVVGLLTLAAAAAFAGAGCFAVAAGCAAGGVALVGESVLLVQLSRPAVRDEGA